jgi:tRNA threonylcarbamoyl adenosine modification protein YeaZ
LLHLAFDTATKWGRFALAEEGRVLAYRPVNISGSYADALLPVIEQVLEEAGRDRRDLGAIGVTVGPGSFTGVRIGVATAKGLAYGLGCELVGVSSLAAMAGALLAENPAAEVAVPALDARRGEIFCGVYGRDGHWVRALVEPAAAAPDLWWQRLRGAVPDLDDPAYGGDGTGLLLGLGDSLRPELVRRGEPVLRRWTSAHPATARALALAMGSGQLPSAHPFTLVPEYMRVSDAEVKRKVDLTPTGPGSDYTIHEGGKDSS